MRLIDADAIKNPYEGTSEPWDWKVLKLVIDSAPTIDLDKVSYQKGFEDGMELRVGEVNLKHYDVTNVPTTLDDPIGKLVDSMVYQVSKAMKNNSK